MRKLCIESVARPWADVELQNCHHQTHACPKWPLIHLPESQQMPLLSPESVAHAWADVELQNCHRHILHHPKWPLNHLPESQQMQILSSESVAHAWADVELQNCHRPTSHNPRWPTEPSARIAANANPVLLNLLHTPELMLNRRTVTAPLLITPGDHWNHLPKSQQMRISVSPESAAHPWADVELQNCHRHSLQHPTWPLNHLPESQQMRTLCIESVARPWADVELQNCHHQTHACPKWPLIHLPESTANAPTVAWICCTRLSWCWTAELSPPYSAPPQVTTEPSARIAANALSVLWICCTRLSWCWTAELSPPYSAPPQVTTEPSARIAANAIPVLWICCTRLSWSWTAELSPPNCAPPQVTIALSPWHHKAKALLVAASCGWSTRTVRHSPSFICASSKVCSKFTKTRFSPVMSLRCFCPKARWAALLKSRTEEDGKSDWSS